MFLTIHLWWVIHICQKQHYITFLKSTFRFRSKTFTANKVTLKKKKGTPAGGCTVWSNLKCFNDQSKGTKCLPTLWWEPFDFEVFVFEQSLRRLSNVSPSASWLTVKSRQKKKDELFWENVEKHRIKARFSLFRKCEGRTAKQHSAQRPSDLDRFSQDVVLFW